MARRGEKPLIGLSVSFFDFRDYQGVGFQRPIALAGGLPLTLPRTTEGLNDVLEACDGIALCGGRDIEPALYGQEPHETLGRTEPRRDAFELELINRALDLGKPLLGMCRGIQILNVALGGTLAQDLSLVPEWENHPSDPGWAAWKEVERASLEEEPEVPSHPRHPISVREGSALHEALGVNEIEVNSFHHQALDEVADDLAVVATAPDGVAEAVELRGDAFGLAVQWELQEEWRVDARFLRVFEHFAKEASAATLSS